jgi:hypothetical protein
MDFGNEEQRVMDSGQKVELAVVLSPVPKCEGPFGYAQGGLGGTRRLWWVERTKDRQ